MLRKLLKSSRALTGVRTEIVVCKGLQTFLEIKNNKKKSPYFSYRLE